MIVFKEMPRMSLEFTRLHPQLQALLVDFDRWSEAQAQADAATTTPGAGAVLFPAPVATELFRTEKEQGEIYTEHFQKLIKLYMQSPSLVSATDRPLIARLSTAPEAVIHNQAVQKFTWHLVGCAADLRTKHYRPSQLARVRTWFAERCAAKQDWELLFHDVTGPHMHVAFKDQTWAAHYKPELTS